MGLGIVGTAMAGAAVGVGEAGKQYGDYLARSTLQDEAAKIQELRDARLNEWQSERDTRLAGERRQELTFADELKREPGKRAASSAQNIISSRMGEISAKRTAEQDATAGPSRVQNLSPQEEARIRAGELEKYGMTGDASTLRREALESDRLDLTRDDQNKDRAARVADRESREKYQNAVLKIQAASEGRLARGAKLDEEIKTITLDNAKRVEELRKEFGAAAPERKAAIMEEIQLLPGKDNDNYLPVPLKDEFGAVTGYKIFDKKRGKFADDDTPKVGAQWNDATGDVYLDGKKLGTAKTRTDAAALVAKARGSK